MALEDAADLPKIAEHRGPKWSRNASLWLLFTIEQTLSSEIWNDFVLTPSPICVKCSYVFLRNAVHKIANRHSVFNANKSLPFRFNCTCSSKFNTTPSDRWITLAEAYRSVLSGILLAKPSLSTWEARWIRLGLFVTTQRLREWFSVKMSH